MNNTFNPGDIVQLDGSGSYKILGCPACQYTRFEIQDIDRGPGWDPHTQTYKGVRYKTNGINGGGGWMRGQNYSYGQTHTIHRNRLTLKKRNNDTHNNNHNPGN